MITTSALFLALSTAVLFAAYGLLSRALAVKSSDPLAFSILYSFFSSIISLLFLIIYPGKFSGINPLIIFITFLATLSYGIFEAVQFFARKYVEASR